MFISNENAFKLPVKSSITTAVITYETLRLNSSVVTCSSSPMVNSTVPLPSIGIVLAVKSLSRRVDHAK